VHPLLSIMILLEGINLLSTQNVFLKKLTVSPNSAINDSCAIDKICIYRSFSTKLLQEILILLHPRSVIPARLFETLLPEMVLLEIPEIYAFPVVV
jgi:hypothetical protein